MGSVVTALNTPKICKKNDFEPNLSPKNILEYLR